MRVFIALELSDAARAGILAVIGEFRQRGVRASWSRTSTIHLTLQFLGDVEESELENVVEAVRSCAADVAPFRMSIGGLGAFPSPRRPRVIWVGVDAPDELYELQERIEGALTELGIKRERRRFHPHVTLGRLRDSTADVERLLGQLTAPVESTRVDSVRVMKSTLASSGAIHEVVAEVGLAGKRRSAGDAS